MFGKDQERVSAGDPVRQMASGTISISDALSFKIDGQRQPNHFYDLRYSRRQDSTVRKWSKRFGEYPTKIPPRTTRKRGKAKLTVIAYPSEGSDAE